MNKHQVIDRLRKISMRTYTYSDCDGGNNRGVELDELEFATKIIRECAKLNYQLLGNQLALNSAYERHFGIKL